MIPRSKYEILIKLQENPLAPALQIAREINTRYSDKERKLSPTTVIKSINWLKENKAFTEVHPVLNDSALGLKLVDVFVQPSSYNSIRKLEMKKNGSCNFPHPYITYHARINGFHEGLYFQFRIPVESTDLLDEFFSELVKRKIVDKYEMLQRDPAIRTFTTADLNAWVPDEFRWDFDGDEWIEGYKSESHEYVRKQPAESILNKLDGIDILLLAELVRNARRKNKDIGKAVMEKLREKSTEKIFPQEISTQDLNWKTFDIYNTVFFTCKATKSTTQSIAAYLENGSVRFPFESVFSGLEDGFFWYMRAPSSVISYVTEFLWQEVERRELSLIDYRSSEIYELWSETYDLTTRKWKTGHDFTVKDPLVLIDDFRI
ncbi:MAG: hypothetical protein ACTSRU_03750 [Candidatus Hodarchaeales archaeon]